MYPIILIVTDSIRGTILLHFPIETFLEAQHFLRSARVVQISSNLGDNLINEDYDVQPHGSSALCSSSLPSAARQISTLRRFLGIFRDHGLAQISHDTDPLTNSIGVSETLLL